MKLDAQSREKLQAELRKRLAEKGLSYSYIALISRVDVSQVSRICRGEFKTLSHNVVQVCKVLGMEFDTVEPKLQLAELTDLRLSESLRQVWDGTPEDAERIVRFLRELAELRRTGGAEPN